MNPFFKRNLSLTEISRGFSGWVTSGATLGELISSRINNLDFLRFFAAALVIFSHSFPLATGSSVNEWFSLLTNSQRTFGTLAVNIFFVISGFLIAQSWVRTKNPLAFVKARFLRLFPALACVVVVTVFIIGPLSTSYSLTKYFSDIHTYYYLFSMTLLKVFHDLPGVFQTNIYGNAINGSLWTLRPEIGCYIMVAVLGWMKWIDRRVILLLFVLAYVACNFLLVDSHSLQNFIRLVLCFLSGMMAFVYQDKIRINSFFALTSLVLSLVLLRAVDLYFTFPIFGAYLILYFSYSRHIRLHDFAKHGDFSYGLYIYAFPIQQLVVQFFGGRMSSYLNFLLSFPLVLLCAYVSWHLVEKRCLQLKKTPMLFTIVKYFQAFPKEIAEIVSKVGPTRSGKSDLS